MCYLGYCNHDTVYVYCAVCGVPSGWCTACVVYPICGVSHAINLYYTHFYTHGFLMSKH